MNMFQLNKELLSTYAKNWRWFIFWGIILIILGIVAISFATLSTIFSVLFLGFLLTASGIIMFIDTFQFWRGQPTSFIFHLLISLLYFLVGLMFIFKPILGALSLTLVLAIAFIVIGIFRIVNAFFHRYWPGNAWRIFSGIITLILGLLIYYEWPASGLFFIGLFVGIDLIMIGWIYIFAALEAKKKYS